MERLKKVLSLVVVVALCSGIASAYYSANVGGGDWNTASTWVDSVTGEAPAAPPTASVPADGIYEVYTTPTTPVTVAAGQSAAAVYAYMSLYTDDGVDAPENGGGINVEGSLTLGALGYGNWSLPSAPATDSLVRVGDAGTLVIGGLYGLFTTGTTQANTQHIVIDGGTATIDLGVFGLGMGGTTTRVAINGDGLLTFNGTAVGTTGSNFQIDITDAMAALVLPTTMKDLFIGQGSILANGVVDNNALVVTDLGGGISQVTIPEPATLALLGLGAVAAFRRKR